MAEPIRPLVTDWPPGTLSWGEAIPQGLEPDATPDPDALVREDIARLIARRRAARAARTTS